MNFHNFSKLNHRQILDWMFSSLLGILFLSNLAFSKGNDAPTFRLNVDGGLATYKSKFVTSNDTSTYTGTSFAIRGGNEKNIEALIATDTINTKFELNSSEIKQSNQNTIIRMYLGPAYLGLLLNQAELQTNVQGTATSDSLSTGMGANLGLSFQIGRGDYFFVDAQSVTTNLVKEVKQSDLKIGPRTDINIGGIIRVTKSVMDARIGYKQSSYSYTLSGTTSSEVVTTTWVGLGFNVFF